MLNVVALMGRLVADPELRHTPNGVATCHVPYRGGPQLCACR